MNANQDTLIGNLLIERMLFLFVESNPPLGEKTPAFVLTLDNIIAGNLLAELLQAKLEQAGQLLSTPTHSGPLMHSFYGFNVFDPHVACAVVREILQKTFLADLARLLRYDPHEEIFRSLYGCLPGGSWRQCPE